MRVISYLILVVYITGCSVPLDFQKFRACLKDDKGYIEVGTVLDKTIDESGRQVYIFQSDSLPRDGKHLLQVDPNKISRCPLVNPSGIGADRISAGFTEEKH